MDTTTINRILAGNTKTREHYLGCFPCDKLPNIINKYPSALVANNDPSNKEGTHWIAMFIVDDKTVYYFDSFGRIPNISLLKYEFQLAHCQLKFHATAASIAFELRSQQLVLSIVTSGRSNGPCVRSNGIRER
ncbi:hypothetical protein niasHT_004314 [Heterodera trifolii]|uniref:Ubiquitin-like protease family profile domain-containing protein n=1 Tax=Heterodera trifolii TaxID=157864 RepID=A0ABD2LR76_9BILA